MARVLFFMLMLSCAAALTGCSGSDENPITPPNPDVYTASANLHNHVVADGTVDTQMSFRQGAAANLANHIVPGGVALDRGLLLDDPSQVSMLEMFLTGGDGTALNPDQEFTLERDKRYVFVALGNLSVASGQLRPHLIQLAALNEPGANKVVFRFTHALAGSPDPVDVHVNGEVARNIAFAQSSPELEFDARAADEDTLVIVPTGVAPGGGSDIYRSEGTTLFVAGLDYEAVLGHRPRSGFNGDINGSPGLYLSEAH